jgi:hypothetical protein
MAIEHHFTKDDHIFRGEDKKLRFPVFEEDNATPKDVSGMALEWVLRGRRPTDAALLTKTTADGITVEGIFNVDPDVNTQEVVVDILDTDTEALDAGLYRHALKRTDPGSETILSFGDFPLLGAAAV